MNSSSNEAEIVLTVANSISVVVCLLAAILVFALKLHTKVVYRLALYQVLASLSLAILEVCQIIFINYDKNVQVYSRLCTAVGFFGTYAAWLKLLFTMWVAFHLFCFGVLHRNLAKLELMYVLSSLLVPAVISVVPLTTYTYGLGPLGSCFIFVKSKDLQEVALVERLALWCGPAIGILLAASTAMVVMVIKLAHRVCWRLIYEPLTEGDQYWKALKQLLPLAAFPLLFFVFVIPILILDIYSAKAKPDKALLFSASISISLWSVFSGVTLLVHITVAQIYRKRRDRDVRDNARRYDTGDAGTFVGKSAPSARTESATRFSIPTQSLDDDM